MADSTDNNVDAVVAPSDPAPLSTEATNNQVADIQAPTSPDDQAVPPVPAVPAPAPASSPPAPVDNAKEIEQEQIISLTTIPTPSDDATEKQDKQSSEVEAIQLEEQDASQTIASAMETGHSAPVPENAPDVTPEVILDSPATVTADPYTEQDGAYEDTELVSDVPVPSNDAINPDESMADEDQSGGDAAEGQMDDSQAKAASTTPTSNKAQGSNNSSNNSQQQQHHHHNRHHHRGRGGYFNNRNNHSVNFQNNNNHNSSRPFNQRPFNNHSNHQGFNNNNNNGYNNNFNNNNNNNHPGGPGPMRRGGYRGVQDQRPYRREESYRGGRQPDHFQQRPRDNFNNNSHNPNHHHSSGPYGGPNQYQQQQPQQQAPYQQRHPQQSQQQQHHHHHQQQQFPNGSPMAHNQNRFQQGPDHNDRQRQQRMPRGPPPPSAQDVGMASPMQNSGPPPVGGRPPKTGSIKSIFDYAKGMQWDRTNQPPPSAPAANGAQDPAYFPNANGAAAPVGAAYNVPFGQAGAQTGTHAATPYGQPAPSAAHGYGQQAPAQQYDPYVAQPPAANTAASAPYQHEWYSNAPNAAQGVAAGPARGANGRDWQNNAEQTTPYKRPANAGRGGRGGGRGGFGGAGRGGQQHNAPGFNSHAAHNASASNSA
ncbi:hypothetical protein BGZ54_009895, partial [Gamsiella multidivaricata]